MTAVEWERPCVLFEVRKETERKATCYTCGGQVWELSWHCSGVARTSMRTEDMRWSRSDGSPKKNTSSKFVRLITNCLPRLNNLIHWWLPEDGTFCYDHYYYYYYYYYFINISSPTTVSQKASNFPLTHKSVHSCATQTLDFIKSKRSSLHHVFSQSLKVLLLARHLSSACWTSRVDWWCVIPASQIVPACPSAVSTPQCERKQRQFRARCNHFLSQDHNGRCYSDALNAS